MSNEIQSAIAKLEAERGEAEQMFREAEQRAREAERNRDGREVAINALLAIIGQGPRYPTGGGGGGEKPGAAATGAAPIVQDGSLKLKPDQFYGKRQQTAIRELLNMRQAAGLGPGTPRAIYESLRDGGFPFETKEETTAIIGVRAMLRKRTAFFHKLPNGSYGLTEWYPHAKKPKAPTGPGASDDGADVDLDNEADADESDAA